MTKRNCFILESETGYAMIELVMSFLVMGIVVGVVYASYLFVARSVVTWQRHMILQNDLHLITQRLAEDLTYTEHLSIESDTAWVLTEASGRFNRYVYRDSVLSRNAVRMHHLDTQIARFDFIPSTPFIEFDRTIRDPRGEDEQSLMQVTLRIDLTGWGTSLTSTTSIALRLSRPWPPMPPMLP